LTGTADIEWGSRSDGNHSEVRRKKTRTLAGEHVGGQIGRTSGGVTKSIPEAQQAIGKEKGEANNGADGLRLWAVLTRPGKALRSGNDFSASSAEKEKKVFRMKIGKFVQGTNRRR